MRTRGAPAVVRACTPPPLARWPWLSFTQCLCLIPAATTTNKRTNKQNNKTVQLDFVKIKNSCTSKDTFKRVKREPTEWDKIFANHIPEKVLLSRTHKELLHVNYNNKTFFKEAVQLANKHLERCSTSLVDSEMHIKTTMRYHFVLIRMAINFFFFFKRT